MEKFILALDQGTSSSRAILFNNDGQIVTSSQTELESIYPGPGRVEQNPESIWTSQLNCALNILRSGIDPVEIAAIGISNQRETTIVWDRNTGIPVYNAIVWQDKRTADFCNELKEKGLSSDIKKRTGLIPDSYFSATKIRWILENVENAREKAEKGELLFGTVDTWILWKLTNGKIHSTDVSNASRTMLFDIHKLQWSKELLELFDIPESMMPDVYETSCVFGKTDIDIFGSEIIISSLVGDQQGALFGHTCFGLGSVKNTYGTGCFMLMNTGDKPVLSNSGLLTTIAWSVDNKVCYALEGSVFIAGAAIQWLRDGLQIISESGETQSIAEECEDNEGVYFVPAFTGMGAPYWRMDVKGAIFGLTRSTGYKHIVRAALESMAYQTKDVLNAMVSDSGIEFLSLRVDGGASGNEFLMQFQADILNVELVRPENVEATAFGAAMLAGLGVGFWSFDDILNFKQKEKLYKPGMSLQKRSALYKGWTEAVRKVIS